MTQNESRDTYWLAGGKIPLPTITKAGVRFGSEEGRLTDFLLFLSRGALLLTVAPALQPRLEPFENHSVAGVIKDSSAADEYLHFSTHEALLHEMVIVRFVDNFLCYLTELLALIFGTRPETLRSSEQERVDFVLQYDSMNDLRAALAEKRIERLAFMGMRELNEYVEDRLGFGLLNGAGLDRAIRLVEMRNAIVHNRGVINKISARRMPSMAPMVGMPIILTDEDIWTERLFLRQAALDIDVRAAAKFGLPVINLPPHPPDQEDVVPAT